MHRRPARPAKLLACALLALLAWPPSAARADDAPPDAWSGNLNLGGALTTGNTDSFSGNLEAKATRAWEADSLTGTAKGIYGITGGDETANSQSLVGRYRHDWTPRLFSYVQAEGGRDTIQLIKWRALASAGPGYRLWEAGEKRHFDGEVGLGYRHEEYLRDGVDAERQTTRDDVNVRAAWEYLDRWGEALEVSHGFEVLLPANDPNGFLVRTNVVFSVPIVDAWFFRTAFELQYLNEPAEDADGDPLDKIDTKTTVGLEYRF